MTWRAVNLAAGRRVLRSPVVRTIQDVEAQSIDAHEDGVQDCIGKTPRETDEHSILFITRLSTTSWTLDYPDCDALEWADKVSLGS